MTLRVYPRETPMRYWLACLLLAGCEPGYLNGIIDLDPPTRLSYTVEPSGKPGDPAGVILRWDNTNNPDVDGWNVYARSATSGPWAFRASTNSNSFHDNGRPELEYYVTASGPGDSESGASNVVHVDERLALARPNTLTSVTLNGAIALIWSDNSYQGSPQGFSYYRVYGASYDQNGNRCGTAWDLEGTTVAPEFRVAALPNGVPRCFAVSAISVEGFESLWSPTQSDTPRPDARNVVLTTRQSADATAGLRFWRDTNNNAKADPGELGRVGPGSAADVDFSVERDGAGRIYLTPVRTGTTIALYGNRPIGDLTEIDYAPTTGYARAGLEAVPGWGYVFQMNGGDQFFRYGAVRVSHVGRDLIILDWSFQTDPGNPELSRGVAP